jgi:hypothetical protein
MHYLGFVLLWGGVNSFNLCLSNYNYHANNTNMFHLFQVHISEHNCLQETVSLLYYIIC